MWGCNRWGPKGVGQLPEFFQYKITWFSVKKDYHRINMNPYYRVKDWQPLILLTGHPPIIVHKNVSVNLYTYLTNGVLEEICADTMLFILRPLPFKNVAIWICILSFSTPQVLVPWTCTSDMSPWLWSRETCMHSFEPANQQFYSSHTNVQSILDSESQPSQPIYKCNHPYALWNCVYNLNRYLDTIITLYTNRTSWLCTVIDRN